MLRPNEYHWRDGVGPRAKRPIKINTNWGGVNEDNAFGTNEYMCFVERLGAEAYVSANVGSAAPSETAEWVEYMTSPNGSTLAKERGANGHPAPFAVRYLGIGNELWGCGGNMRAEEAAGVTNRYAQFAKSGTGKMLKIASGPSDEDYAWTDTMMRLSAKNIDGCHFTITHVRATRIGTTRAQRSDTPSTNGPRPCATHCGWTSS